MDILFFLSKLPSVVNGCKDTTFAFLIGKDTLDKIRLGWDEFNSLKRRIDPSPIFNIYLKLTQVV